MNDSDSTSADGQAASAVASVQQPKTTPDHETSAGSEVAVNSAEFPPLDEQAGSNSRVPLERFYDVSVRVWAELGQVTVPIGELLQLGEGAVIKLSRPVSDPIDLVAQGVQFAKGEVVVVDDCFAIRITEIDSDRVPDG